MGKTAGKEFLFMNPARKRLCMALSVVFLVNIAVILLAQTAQAALPTAPYDFTGAVSKLGLPKEELCQTGILVDPATRKVLWAKNADKAVPIASMTKIMMILVIQNVVAAVMVLVMGKVTDRFGTRLPLIIVSFVIASSMMLWVSSAWFGIYPILIYQVLGGVAGNTHSMLAVN